MKARAVGIFTVLSLLAATSLVPSIAHAQRGKRETKKAEEPKDTGKDESKPDHEDIALAVGETKTLPTAGVKNFTDPPGGIVDVRTSTDGSQFIIVGKKPGSTTLLLIKNDGTQLTYDLSVANRSPAIVEREVRDLIEGVPGVRARRVGGRLFIEGGVATDTDAKRIQKIADAYPGQVESLVFPGGQSGSDRKVLIRLDFFFVSYQRDSSYAVGIGWPAQIGGNTAQGQPIAQSRFTFDFVNRTTTTATASVVNTPLPKLDIGSRYGWARVLKQSSVISSNGAEAKFDSGGEQNFLQNVGLTTSLVKVEFGTNVTVLPRYDAVSKDVEIKLTADVSDLTPPTAGTVPGRATTKLNSLVSLKLGQALVLSGIKTLTKRRTIDGLPLLSEIPVLGVLFGTHGQQEQEYEGAIFIVPSVIDSVPKSALEVIKNAMSTYKDFHGDFDSVEAFQKKPPSAN